MTGELYDPFDYALHQDPYPTYRRLRDEQPLYYHPRLNFYALSRYADVAAAVRNFRVFSSAEGTNLEPLAISVKLLINTDPPEHMRLRHLLGNLFTPARMATLETLVRNYAQSLLAPVREAGRFDIIADFAARLPMAVICRLLGFPAEDEDMLREWTDLVVHRDEGVFEMPLAGQIATGKLYAYFEADLRRRAGTRQDDVTQILIDAQAAGQLSHEELLGYLYILSIAGNETTTKLIGNMAWHFSQHPDLYAQARADHSLWPLAVEETMRLDGPTHMMARTTAAPIDIAGGHIPAGSKVALLFMSANRDERKYPAPDQFQIRRNPRDHLGFGAGLHACLGSALARMEARIAWEELSTMMGDFSIDEAGTARMHSPQVRGFTHLPVSFH